MRQEKAVSCQSSPRPWRCFRGKFKTKIAAQVFSTSVEVFREVDPKGSLLPCLLHVRGGVSERKYHQHKRHRVFSTSVEVFLPTKIRHGKNRSLLHVRGGVSCRIRIFKIILGSSPRPWRCFHAGPVPWSRPVVFSTSVEVFPKPAVTF